MPYRDDDAQPADLAVIDLPIEGAAPEAADVWRSLRGRCGLTVHPIEDRKGLTIRARKTRIEFDPKSTAWIWLLAFSGWKAWRLHGPHLYWRWLTTQTIDPDLRSADPTYAEAEEDYEAIRYAMRDIRDLESVDDIDWPENVPRPQVDKTGFDVEHQAAFDLTIIALAYLLLHEARHVQFYVDKNRPDPMNEEIACDAFARDHILAGAARYAADAGFGADEVVAKRSAGVMLGAVALYDLTPSEGRGGSTTYPPVADRLALICEAITLPDESWLWDFAASLLMALIVRDDQRFIVPEVRGRELCSALIEHLRIRNENAVL